MKHSPLESAHHEAGARMIEFAGWLMPVQYKGIREEHQAVREKVGMFDISHMGELVVSGERAAEWLESLLTNRLSKCAVGRGQYTLLLNEAGGVIDDLLIYRLGEKEFFLVINAGRYEEDVAWLQQHLPQDGTVCLEDKSDFFSAIAIQGPQAAEILSKLFPGITLPKRNGLIDFFRNSTADANGGVASVLASSSISIYTAGLRAEASCPSSPAASLERSLMPMEGHGWIARTGYTGEDGFEIFLSHAAGLALWKNCLALGVAPCGLGARDTLRLEMGYPLNGADLSPLRTALEAGLEKFLSLEDPLKPDFIGRAALMKQRGAALVSRLTPLKIVKGVTAPPLRAHYSIYNGDQLLGETTSGALSPSLGEGIAMAYLPVDFFHNSTADGNNGVAPVLASSSISRGLRTDVPCSFSPVANFARSSVALATSSSSLEVEIRGRRFPIEVTTLPFYKK